MLLQPMSSAALTVLEVALFVTRTRDVEVGSDMPIKLGHIWHLYSFSNKPFKIEPLKKRAIKKRRHFNFRGFASTFFGAYASIFHMPKKWAFQF